MEETALTQPEEMVVEKGGQDVEIYNPLIPTRHEWAVFTAMAKNASKTKFAQNLGGEAGIITIMLYARELRIPPMLAVMGGFHNIQGHVEMSARLINMRIRQEGHGIELKELTDEKCALWGKRKDTAEEQIAVYTIQDAQVAKLVKPDSNWVKHPQDMLWARAITRLGRRLFPDVIGNAYVEGEIQEIIDVTPTRTATVTKVDGATGEITNGKDPYAVKEPPEPEKEVTPPTTFEPEIEDENPGPATLQPVTHEANEGKSGRDLAQQDAEAHTETPPAKDERPDEEIIAEFFNKKTSGVLTWEKENRFKISSLPPQVQKTFFFKFKKVIGLEYYPWLNDQKRAEAIVPPSQPEETAGNGPGEDNEDADAAKAFDEMVPEETDRKSLDTYVERCATHFQMSVPEFKADIVIKDQMDAFWNAYQGTLSQETEERASEAEGNDKDDDGKGAPGPDYDAEMSNYQSVLGNWLYKRILSKFDLRKAEDAKEGQRKMILTAMSEALDKKNSKVR